MTERERLLFEAKNHWADRARAAERRLEAHKGCWQTEAELNTRLEQLEEVAEHARAVIEAENVRERGMYPDDVAALAIALARLP